MTSTVNIRTRGAGIAKVYIADVQGKFGGGYQGAMAGREPHEAAGFAVREMMRYASHNSEGGVLVAPPEVLALIPEHLRSIKGKD